MHQPHPAFTMHQPHTPFTMHWHHTPFTMKQPHPLTLFTMQQPPPPRPTVSFHIAHHLAIYKYYAHFYVHWLLSVPSPPTLCLIVLCSWDTVWQVVGIQEIFLLIERSLVSSMSWFLWPAECSRKISLTWVRVSAHVSLPGTWEGPG